MVSLPDSTSSRNKLERYCICSSHHLFHPGCPSDWCHISGVNSCDSKYSANPSSYRYQMGPFPKGKPLYM
ncbi:MAG: hypothetical protein M1454_04665, partial [Candidatus Thermoplasmatota archaeon]|nr:hypothetical protein [Candidatus Thermoplasmatota archaeon]